jgi:hypothetical protein
MATAGNISDGTREKADDNISSAEEIIFQKTYKYTKNGVFWDVTLCGNCKNRRFGGT